LPSLSTSWNTERAAEAAATSSRHDGAVTQQCDSLEKRRTGQLPPHDSAARVRLRLHGDSVNLITKQQRDDSQQASQACRGERSSH
jgi:hypothetical protein